MKRQATIPLQRAHNRHLEHHKDHRQKHHGKSLAEFFGCCPSSTRHAIAEDGHRPRHAPLPQRLPDATVVTSRGPLFDPPTDDDIVPCGMYRTRLQVRAPSEVEDTARQQRRRRPSSAPLAEPKRVMLSKLPTYMLPSRQRRSSALRTPQSPRPQRWRSPTPSEDLSTTDLYGTLYYDVIERKEREEAAAARSAASEDFPVEPSGRRPLPRSYSAPTPARTTLSRLAELPGGALVYEPSPNLQRPVEFGGRVFSRGAMPAGEAATQQRGAPRFVRRVSFAKKIDNEALSDDDNDAVVATEEAIFNSIFGGVEISLDNSSTSSDLFLSYQMDYSGESIANGGNADVDDLDTASDAGPARVRVVNPHAAVEGIRHDTRFLQAVDGDSDADDAASEVDVMESVNDVDDATYLEAQPYVDGRGGNFVTSAEDYNATRFRPRRRVADRDYVRGVQRALPGNDDGDDEELELEDVELEKEAAEEEEEEESSEDDIYKSVLQHLGPRINVNVIDRSGHIELDWPPMLDENPDDDIFEDCMLHMGPRVNVHVVDRTSSPPHPVPPPQANVHDDSGSGSNDSSMSLPSAFLGSEAGQEAATDMAATRDAKMAHPKDSNASSLLLIDEDALQSYDAEGAPRKTREPVPPPVQPAPLPLPQPRTMTAEVQPTSAVAHELSFPSFADATKQAISAVLAKEGKARHGQQEKAINEVVHARLAPHRPHKLKATQLFDVAESKPATPGAAEKAAAAATVEATATKNTNVSATSASQAADEQPVVPVVVRASQATTTSATLNTATNADHADSFATARAATFSVPSRPVKASASPAAAAAAAVQEVQSTRTTSTTPSLPTRSTAIHEPAGAEVKEAAQPSQTPGRVSRPSVDGSERQPGRKQAVIDLDVAQSVKNDVGTRQLRPRSKTQSAQDKVREPASHALLSQKATMEHVDSIPMAAAATNGSSEKLSRMHETAQPLKAAAATEQPVKDVAPMPTASAERTEMRSSEAIAKQTMSATEATSEQKEKKSKAMKRQATESATPVVEAAAVRAGEQHQATLSAPAPHSTAAGAASGEGGMDVEPQRDADQVLALTKFTSQPRAEASRTAGAPKKERADGKLAHIAAPVKQQEHCDPATPPASPHAKENSSITASATSTGQSETEKNASTGKSVHAVAVVNDADLIDEEKPCVVLLPDASFTFDEVIQYPCGTGGGVVQADSELLLKSGVFNNLTKNIIDGRNVALISFTSETSLLLSARAVIAQLRNVIAVLKAVQMRKCSHVRHDFELTGSAVAFTKSSELRDLLTEGSVASGKVIPFALGSHPILGPVIMNISEVTLREVTQMQGYMLQSLSKATSTETVVMPLRLKQVWYDANNTPDTYLSSIFVAFLGKGSRDFIAPIYERSASFPGPLFSTAVGGPSYTVFLAASTAQDDPAVRSANLELAHRFGTTIVNQPVRSGRLNTFIKFTRTSLASPRPGGASSELMRLRMKTALRDAVALAADPMHIPVIIYPVAPKVQQARTRPAAAQQAANDPSAAASKTAPQAKTQPRGRAPTQQDKAEQPPRQDKQPEPHSPRPSPASPQDTPLPRKQPRQQGQVQGLHTQVQPQPMPAHTQATPPHLSSLPPPAPKPILRDTGTSKKAPKTTVPRQVEPQEAQRTLSAARAEPTEKRAKPVVKPAMGNLPRGRRGDGPDATAASAKTSGTAYTALLAVVLLEDSAYKELQAKAARDAKRQAEQRGGTVDDTTVSLIHPADLTVHGVDKKGATDELIYYPQTDTVIKKAVATASQRMTDVSMALHDALNASIFSVELDLEGGPLLQQFTWRAALSALGFVLCESANLSTNDVPAEMEIFFSVIAPGKLLCDLLDESASDEPPPSEMASRRSQSRSDSTASSLYGAPLRLVVSPICGPHISNTTSNTVTTTTQLNVTFSRALQRAKAYLRKAYTMIIMTAVIRTYDSDGVKLSSFFVASTAHVATMQAVVQQRPLFEPALFKFFLHSSYATMLLVGKAEEFASGPLSDTFDELAKALPPLNTYNGRARTVEDFLDNLRRTQKCDEAKSASDALADHTFFLAKPRVRMIPMYALNPTITDAEGAHNGVGLAEMKAGSVKTVVIVSSNAPSTDSRSGDAGQAVAMPGQGLSMTETQVGLNERGMVQPDELLQQTGNSIPHSRVVNELVDKIMHGYSAALLTAEMRDSVLGSLIISRIIRTILDTLPPRGEVFWSVSHIYANGSRYDDRLNPSRCGVQMGCLFSPIFGRVVRGATIVRLDHTQMDIRQTLVEGTATQRVKGGLLVVQLFVKLLQPDSDVFMPSVLLTVAGGDCAAYRSALSERSNSENILYSAIGGMCNTVFLVCLSDLDDAQVAPLLRMTRLMSQQRNGSMTPCSFMQFVNFTEQRIQYVENVVQHEKGERRKKQLMNSMHRYIKLFNDASAMVFSPTDRPPAVYDMLSELADKQ